MEAQKVTLGVRCRTRDKPLGEGELDRVLDEAVATRTDDEGGSCLDAVLQHHICSNATGMEGNLIENRHRQTHKCVTLSFQIRIFCFLLKVKLKLFTAESMHSVLLILHNGDGN